MKWRKVDDNSIKIFNKTDSAIKVKLTVSPKEPLDDKGWYKTAQCISRVLMMVRNVSFSYRNQYAMALTGFMPTIGNGFGQHKENGVLTPGLDFAFGLIDDSYIDKAREHQWLLNSDMITPATTNNTEDLQLRMTIEPVKNMKIDLNASRTETRSRSVLYMDQGNSVNQTGNFNMTTISIGSAFEGMGNATNGYHSGTFKKFVESLDSYAKRFGAQYGGIYQQAMENPEASPIYGEVNKYSADVMIPAFLNAYTSMGGNGLHIFPKLRSLLPNWNIRYSGLSQLPGFRDLFKSVNINHGYKSIYAVGSYQTYSTWQEYMNGLGFITDVSTKLLIPSSMYNVSQVSINEAFSPLLGVDVTLQNNLTAKVEYRQTRVVTLSMTSIQINEALSKDFVIGAGYKINNFSLFGGGSNHRKVKGRKKGNDDQEATNNNKQNNNTNKKGGLNHDLNLRLDVSYRKQAAIIRDIASMESTASSGNTAFKMSFSADYTLSRLITMSFYYDMQTNTPLLSSSSYPTTTHDFGLNVKMSLTR